MTGPEPWAPAVPAPSAPGEPGPDQPRPDRPGPDQPGAGEQPAAGSRTGHPRVDAALEILDRAAGLPPPEQVAAFEAAHRTLQEALAAIDDGQG